MLTKRLIARLDLKAPQGVVKGLKMEGLRVVGDPYQMATHYAEEGADELLCLDVAASLHGRTIIFDWIRAITKDVYIPVTVGGGVRSLDDIRALLRAGADKVAINSAAHERPAFITEAAEAFGSQAIVVSVEARQVAGGMWWTCLKWQGREDMKKPALDWIVEAQALGAGEILLTSVDHDGMRDGIDSFLLLYADQRVSIPLVYSGGCGSAEDVAHALQLADGVAIGSLLHYGIATIPAIKCYLRDIMAMEVRL